VNNKVSREVFQEGGIFFSFYEALFGSGLLGDMAVKFVFFKILVLKHNAP